MNPPEQQVRAGEIARDAILLGKRLCKNEIQGVTLDREIETYIRDNGGTPALKGFKPGFADREYKHTICLVTDEGVVHGVPDEKVIRPDQLITIDLVVNYEGWHADTARTFTHSGDLPLNVFVNSSKAVIDSAIDAIDPNMNIGVFGSYVSEYSKMWGYGNIVQYCGHGIGKQIHQHPQVLNCYEFTTNIFKPGEAYAVEPVLAISPDYKLHHLDDYWTVMADCLVSHNEDTIFVSNDKIINLTGDLI